MVAHSLFCSNFYAGRRPRRPEKKQLSHIKKTALGGQNVYFAYCFIFQQSKQNEDLDGCNYIGCLANDPTYLPCAI